MWNYVLLFCLVRQHKCELFHALFSSLLSIAPVYLTMSVHSITFLVHRPFQLEGVMAVSVGVKTRSSEKIVLPVDGDRTTVVLAQEPAPPHITQTHADCTPTQLDKEPATPLLTPTQQIVTQFLLTQHHLHHRAPKHEQLLRQLQCPKHEDHHSDKSTLKAEEELFLGQVLWCPDN